MPDWTDTLDMRQAGELEGFLAVNEPLEDQEEQGTTAEGPINVEPREAEPEPAVAEPAAEVNTPQRADEGASAKPARK